MYARLKNCGKILKKFLPHVKHKKIPTTFFLVGTGKVKVDNSKKSVYFFDIIGTGGEKK